MKKLAYKELEIAIVLLEESDIMTTSGDGENFGATMSGWWDFTMGGIE